MRYDAGIAKANRQILVSAAYRWLVSFGLFIGAFNVFSSDHAVFACFCIVLAGLLVAPLGTLQDIAYRGQNAMDDLAERKTRHLILFLARNRDSLDRIDDYDVWSSVDKNVEVEKGPEPERPKWYVGFLTASGALLWSVTADLIGIGIAAAIAAN